MKKTWIIAIIAIVVIAAVAIGLIIGLGPKDNYEDNDNNKGHKPSMTFPSGIVSPSTAGTTTGTPTTTSSTSGLPTPAPQSELEFELNANGEGYYVAGIGTYEDSQVDIPEEYKGLPVTAIAEDAFYGNSNIERVNIPEGVVSIGNYAFENCSNLERVYIPESMEYISTSAFSGCNSLEIIEYRGTSDQWRSLVSNIYDYDIASLQEVICDDMTIDLAESRKVTIWVSTTEGIKPFTEMMIEEFMNMYPEFAHYEITIQTVGEGDAAIEVLKDLETAPDIYCFTQDQTSRLAAAGALLPLDDEIADHISAENDVSSVVSATVDGQIYAFPMTNDNGYYLYYDASVISDEEAKTFEGIIAACERENKHFAYDVTNGWYVAGFFFSQPVGGGTPICNSTWIYSEDGKKAIGVNDTWNSENGLVAMKAMRMVTTSPMWVGTADNFAGTAAIVTGIWNANVAESEYGDNMRATKLPTFTVDGQTYQMGSFSGCKLMGVKPQQDPEKETFLCILAEYLTSEDAQLERYYEFQWGPSNLEAQNNQDVKDNKLLAALLAQNVYSQPQGPIPNDWWVEAAQLGYVCMVYDIYEDDMRAALEIYEERINAMVDN